MCKKDAAGRLTFLLDRDILYSKNANVCQCSRASGAWKMPYHEPIRSERMKGKMKYLYDPHTHTSEVSRCGHLSAAEVIQLYHDHQFSGIAVTDHLHETYISSLDCRDDWQACVTAYMQGYYASKKAAEAFDMDVIFGIEIRFPKNDRDYLVYGIDEDFLRKNPYLYRMGLAEFFKRFGDETLIIQAHPYRGYEAIGERIEVEYLHGLELFNGNPRHDNQNDRAAELQKQHPRLIGTYGSDTHRPGDEARAAVVLPRRVADSFAFAEAIESRQFEVKAFC